MRVPCANFGKMLVRFCNFQNLNFATQEFGIGGTALLMGTLFGEMDCIFRFSMMSTSIPKSFSKFGANLGHLKVKKPSKNTSLPLFGHTGSSLGSTFEGGNDLQMKNLKMFQKLDRNTFIASYIGLNLVKEKDSKIWSEAALRIGTVALHIG